MQNLTIELIILAETNCDHQNNISEEITALPIFETWVKHKKGFEVQS